MHKSKWIIRLVLLLAVFPAYSRADDRSLDDSEGIFLVEDSATEVSRRLKLGVWQDGLVLLAKDRADESEIYSGFVLSEIELKRLKELIVAKGTLDYEGKVLDYGVPGSSWLTLDIRLGGKSITMRSSIGEYETRKELVATKAGIVPLSGQSRLDVLSREPNEFIFQRLVWEESLRAIEGALLKCDSVRIPVTGHVMRTGGKVVFRSDQELSKAMEIE